MKKQSLLFVVFGLLVIGTVGAADVLDVPSDSSDVQPVPECATLVFTNALMANASEVNVSDDEYLIRAWIYKNFQSPDVIKKVLACPEIASIPDNETIKFQPIEYTFLSGRQIVVNYETQPKILKQRLMLETKRSLPDTNPSPKIGAFGDTNIWTNTEPAWYGILVVQSGTLDSFIGADKNYTLSLNYLEQNIDKFFPQNSRCTSRSALADDNEIINRAAHRTTGEPDSFTSGNDYYVAGDVSLRWITWTEVAFDVVVTVATFGGGAAVIGATKGIRASKAAKNVVGVMKNLETSEKVADFLKVSRRTAKATDELNDLRKIKSETDAAKKLAFAAKESPNLAQLQKNLAVAEQNLERIKSARQRTNMGAREAQNLARQQTTYQQQVNKIRNQLNGQNIDGIIDAAIKNRTDELAKLGETLKGLETAEDVQKYKTASSAFDDLMKLRRALKGARVAQRGNVVARGFKAMRTALFSGEKVISQGAKIGRAGLKSGKIRDWMFQSTLKNIGKLGKMEAAGGFIYGALHFAGDMYDWSETSTGEFTSGIKFKPLGLLSADALEGQTNVVNHGMWLMWAGDSLDARDDDAAYLQAMDFASKFHQDVVEYQDEIGVHACDIDIFVVRPIVRNPGTADEALYYLIMNDAPWSTRE